MPSIGIYGNPTFINVSNTILKSAVVLRVNTNETYRGTFVTFSPEFDVLLDNCHRIDLPDEGVSKFFKCQNIVEMTACDVQTNEEESGFTDAAITKISKSQVLDEKKLEEFTFDEQDSKLINGDMSTGSGWAADDMLMTNRTKYGYKSTYNADLSEYTIAIEREDSEEYRRREKVAEKIANEIESNLMYRHNVDIELSDGEGEEEAFSAVVRQTTEINNNNNSSLNNNNNNNTSSNSSGNSSMSKEFHHGKSSRRSFNKQQQLQRNSMIGFYANLTNLNSSTGGGHKNKSNRHQQQQQQANGQNSLGFSTRRVDLKIY